MAEPSVIGRGTVVRGNVRGDSSLEIQGRVEGDVTVAGDVVLGEEAVVRGNITGAQLSIAGTVQGDLRGNESLLVERGARVVGDLSSPRIGVAPGALVRGNVRTDGEAPLVSAQRRPGAAGQALRGTLPARPAVSTPKLEPVKAAPPAPPPPSAPSEPEPLESEPPSAPAAKAPPPVVPALGKHAKAKKKRRDA
ncbi:MAG: bactofilin family protein [Myxococcota bacterium]